MKKLLFAAHLLLAPAVHAATSNEPTGLNLGRQDRQLHAAVSYAMTYTGAKMFSKLGCTDTQAALISGTSVLMLGLMKEMTDSTGFSVGDMKANTLGVLVGVGMSFAF